jgi:NAD(P)-dependent dehydrogenase (short-subunit alcohol dehydrogenase family)
MKQAGKRAMQRVKDKSIIITGAALGIGRAAAILCAQQGATIAVTDINEEEGKKVVKEIQASGGQAHFWHLNTADEKEVQKVFSEIHTKFGKIDVLVNNAGIAGINKPTHEISESEWDAVMAINVKGVFFCTKHVIPYLQKNQGGSIINLSSIYGLVGAHDVPPYHASKGAVRLMSKTDAMLYAKDKIRVNSVHPGFILTPLVSNLGQQFPGGPAALFKHLDGLHPLGHMGEADDIAYGILYLASDESKFMTGSELVIDGGYTAR